MYGDSTPFTTPLYEAYVCNSWIPLEFITVL